MANNYSIALDPAGGDDEVAIYLIRNGEPVEVWSKKTPVETAFLVRELVEKYFKHGANVQHVESDDILHVEAPALCKKQAE